MAMAQTTVGAVIILYWGAMLMEGGFMGARPIYRSTPMTR